MLVDFRKLGYYTTIDSISIFKEKFGRKLVFRYKLSAGALKMLVQSSTGSLRRADL